ncbi:MAG TPA: tRNA (adenosine(37)-N6)-threonylcarbamoyltransferase complex transferase subunit TsaD [Candidatus Staskawiczbacteria bacterium]|nr:tRNA (adenosine(37)-N6)-threonylcarbamoyltransferase complex transferase subunit TsaD [Candidatus Staskawiczbacteria bacterium]
MKILAIETSCDDTGVAILSADKGGNFNVLANVVSSQIEIHRKYGGVYPFAAKREHQKNLPIAYKKALKDANVTEKEIDLIAVTAGPGLEPCLWVGVTFTQELAKKLSKPVVAANHIEGHILVNYLTNKNIDLPALALIVSGGHTQIILVKNIGDYKILGETRDDAAGECFDKAAKILGLPYPGGPEISKLAEKSEPGKISLPRPMINTKDYDFSFSGLKTAVLYHHQKQDKKIQKDKKYISQMAAEIQQAIIDVLIKKTLKAAADYDVKTIILGGGVSANHELKTQLVIRAHQELADVKIIFPQIDHSTDNGLMTAMCGHFHQKETTKPQDLKADANLRVGS